MRNLDDQVNEIVENNVLSTLQTFQDVPQEVEDQANWYRSLIQDLDNSIFQIKSTIEIVKIHGWYAIGSHINKHRELFKTNGYHGSGIARKVAKSLGTNHVYIYDAMRFAEMFPDIKKVPMEKIKSWNHLRNTYLMAESSEEKEKKEKTCPHCGKVID